MAAAVFTALDADGDGFLSHDEITTALGGARSELFEALDAGERDGRVSPEEWRLFCLKLRSGKGANGLGLFLEAFRKKLAHIGRPVAAPHVAEGAGSWGVRVSVTPRDGEADFLVRMAQEAVPAEWAEFRRLAMEGWTHEADVGLVRMVDWLTTEKLPECSSMSALEDFACQELITHQTAWRKAFPMIQESEPRLAARFLALRRLSVWVHERVLPFCDLNALQAVAFGRCVAASRSLFFRQLKLARFSDVVNETVTAGQKELSLDRMKMLECRDSGACDDEGVKMLFAQASHQAQGCGRVVLRSTERPLHISYVNEEGVDAGGLYRDFMDSCAAELMSPSLPLFVRTPNNRSNSGECREAWQLAPRPTTPATRRMLKFLGQIMGICLRRGDVLPLSLSPVAWKLLVGEEPTLEDLGREDAATAASVQSLQNVEALGVTPGDFEDFFGEMCFVFHNSAGVEVSLGKRGAQKRVTFKNAQKFAELIKEMRLHEAAEQVALLRAGMAMVVPVGCLSLWCWHDLELRVCGNPFVDVEALKRHASLDGYKEGDAPVRYLWHTLTSMGQEDLTRFVHFCWGRSRLPPEGSSQWDVFKITLAADIPADGLPRAHTCFFQLDLPRYPSRQVAAEKILYAVQNCVSIQIS